jgi:crotonobetainyl-CoA:carnitine CoA-transferase CaiB-like acyl-CoA transferase
MFSGLTVVESGEFVAAPYCGRLLADLGARVIKLEPLGGDVSRRYGPFPGGVPDPEKSGLFTFLNTGKESVVADLADAGSVERVQALAAHADVWLTGHPRRELAEQGLDWDALSRANPRLVYCALSTFGWSGPYRDRPGGGLHASALAGVTWAIGSPERPPLQLPLAQADFQGGVNAACAILVALYSRHRNGAGQFIDVALAEVLANYAGIGSTLYLDYGLQFRRDGQRASGSMGPYPLGIFPCKDGLVVLIARTPRDWDRFLEAMGSPAWSANPRYRDQVAMGRDYPDEVDALVKDLLKDHSREELFRMAREQGFPLAPLRTIQDSLEDTQFAHRNFFETVELQGIGSVKLPRLPFQFSKVKPRPLSAPARLGQHTEAVLHQRH